MAPAHRLGAGLSASFHCGWVSLLLASGSLVAETVPSPAAADTSSRLGRLSVKPGNPESAGDLPLIVPLPAHAAQPAAQRTAPDFQVVSSRDRSLASVEKPPPSAEYLLPDRDEKPTITPENSNLNLAEDLKVVAQDSGETILLPAGTYRQILQLPIDSPTLQRADQIRRDQALPAPVARPKSRYAEPEKKPVWVRYESLEKIRIGETQRRGGIDLPANGPPQLGPRVWYAKSESADVASSLLYFVFGGLGYSVSNLAGWSVGNTREIPGDFEYRLIRR